MKIHFLYFLILLFILNKSYSQFPPHNSDESKVPPYLLPDPLISAKGKPVTSVMEWEKSRRPYILKLFNDNIYGKVPGRPRDIYFQTTDVDSFALNGKAIRKQILINFSEDDKFPCLNLLLYLPKKKYPVSVFVCLNFLGNHTISNDKSIKIARYWRTRNFRGISDITDPETLRGVDTSSWPLEEIISKGYGIATAHYEDLEQDNTEGWKQGIRSALKDILKIEPKEWGAISVWAWEYSRIQDYLESDHLVNSKRTIIVGHSRLGKTALWAGANDQRFSIVISNNSGECGAALSKRVFGETIRNLNTAFPYWCIEQYKRYNDHPELLPVDQHMLLALIAPRPLYVASAEKDTWADPRGEFLSAKNAEPVYRLYNRKGLGVNEMPALNHPVGHTIHYHIRTGEHAITAYDWKQYLEFARKYKK